MGGGRATQGRNFAVDGSFAPQGEAVAASETDALPIHDRHEPSTWMHFVSDWLASLPRPVTAALTISGFLILINVFTGMHKIWFHWPVAVLLFGVILRTALGHRPASERKRGRRTGRE
jgi:adenylate cyclase